MDTFRECTKCKKTLSLDVFRVDRKPKLNTICVTYECKKCYNSYLKEYRQKNKVRIALQKDGWHIDHVRPLASFDLSDRSQFLTACHYSNLQPLWAVENLSKGSKEGSDLF